MQQPIKTLNLFIIIGIITAGLFNASPVFAQITVSELKAKISSIQADFNSLNSQIAGLQQKINSLQSKILKEKNKKGDSKDESLLQQLQDELLSSETQLNEVLPKYESAKAASQEAKSSIGGINNYKLLRGSHLLKGYKLLDSRITVDALKPPYCLGPWATVWSKQPSGGLSSGQCYEWHAILSGQAPKLPSGEALEKFWVPEASPHCFMGRANRAPVVGPGQRGSVYCPLLNDVVKLSASNDHIQEGGSFTINWSAPFALSCTLSGKAPETGKFSEEFSGTTRATYIRGSKSYNFVQRGIYAFQFSCNGYLDNVNSLQQGKVTRKVIVSVGDIPPPPKVVEFKLEPPIIKKGESATLSWKAKNATALSINQRIGVVKAQGSKKVSPKFTTRYRITAAGEFPELGLARKSVTLRVVAPEVKPVEEATIEAPPDVEIEAPKPTEKPQIDLKINGLDGPLTVRAPANLNLSWNLDKYCLAYGSWLGVKRKAGQETRRETKSGTYTYKLYCPTAGSDEVTVKVVGGRAGEPTVPLPVAEASVSLDGKNFSKSIRVVRGEPTKIWLGAGYDVTGDNRASRDETGHWTGLLSLGGRCEWNSDLNQGDPIFDVGVFDPQNAEECAIPLGELTFYDNPGVYRYGVLRLAQSDGKLSNISYINIAIKEPPPPDGPPVIDLRINNLEGPVTLGAPAEYVVSWNTKNADSCFASDDWEGGKFLAGFRTFAASEKAELTYTLTCEGKLGTTKESIFLRVAELPVCDFSATPMIIDSRSAFNRQSILDWKCQFANTCSIDPEVGPIDIFGSTRVSPRTTTTYTLTCENLEGVSSFDQLIELK